MPRTDICPVFIYGTLFHRYLRQHLFHRSILSHAAVLEDWFRVDTGDLYRTLVPRPGAETKGELIYLSPEELKHLDAWENRYVRRSVEVKAGGRNLDAYVYLLTEVD